MLWRHSIDTVVERWPDAAFVEVGPRRVLFNLLHKKWHRVRKFHVDSVEDTGSHLDAVIRELLELSMRDVRRYAV